MSFYLRRQLETEPFAGAEAGGDDRGDAELVRLALDGNEDAFTALVARYSRRAFWIAFHVVGRIEDARDVVQESFVRLHRSLASYDFGRNFYTWFYRIVTNLAIDSLRRTRASRSTDLEPFADLLPAGGDSAETAAQRGETRSRVWGVLESLDPKFKAVLVLRDIHGLSCREIAPILQVTHATVRWRLHRGRQLFRDGWERSERGAGRPAESW
jgi:RNA polymerase sigma-70 factor (ECF subfamily)